MFILAIGICSCVASNLGTSPTNSVPYVCSVCADVDLGICTTLYLSLLIVLQWIILGKDFKLVMLLQLFPSFLIGIYVSFITRIFELFPAPTFYPVQLAYSIFGIVVSAIGVITYLDHNIVSLPAEGMVEAFVHRFHMEFPYAKMLFDCLMVTLSVAIAFICTGGIVGVREGTALSAFGVGFSIKTIRKYRAKRKKA